MDGDLYFGMQMLRSLPTLVKIHSVRAYTTILWLHFLDTAV